MGTVNQTRQGNSTVLKASYYDLYGPDRSYRLDYVCDDYVFVPWYQETTSHRTFYRNGPTLGADDDFKTGEQLRSDLRRERASSFDTGHDFYTRRKTITHTHPSVKMTSELYGPSGNISHYTGPLVANVTGGHFPPDSTPSLGDLYSAGRVAISRTIPTAPEANLAALIGELAQHLPQLIGRQIKQQGLGTRQTGSEYLNVEFGLRPLVSDLEKLAQGVLNAASTARQMTRDSGTNVHRRRTLQDDSTYRDVSGTTGYLGMSRHGGQDSTPLFISGNHPALSSSDVIHQKTWFSGAFTFHLAEAHSFLGKLDSYEALANKLLGTRITPEVIWQLTPWSWLINWWSDVDAFFKNVTAFSNDSLVLRYGYIMSETRSVRTHTYRGIVPAVKGSVPQSVSVFYTDHVKRRVKATPYGFDIDLSSLSPRQWAILGALGMTKGPSNRLR